MYCQVAEGGCTVELNITVFRVKKLDKDRDSSSLNQFLSVALWEQVKYSHRSTWSCYNSGSFSMLKRLVYVLNALENE